VFFVPAINDAILSLILNMVNVEKHVSSATAQRRNESRKVLDLTLRLCAVAREILI
jgi:hypothetical protein